MVCFCLSVHVCRSVCMLACPGVLLFFASIVFSWTLIEPQHGVCVCGGCSACLVCWFAQLDCVACM